MGQIQRICQGILIDEKNLHTFQTKENLEVNADSSNQTLQMETTRININSNTCKSGLCLNFKEKYGIIKIQASYRAYSTRKNWYIIKQPLLELENQLIDRFHSMMKAKGPKIPEKYFFSPSDKEGRKILINNTGNEFKNDTVFHVKLRVYKSTYYEGYLNIYDLKHGYGVLINADGDIYEGFWRNDTFSGLGRVTSSSGIVSEGNFENGLLTGIAERRYLEYSYKGEFKKGMKDGFGNEENQVHSYEGNFKMDKKEGYGKLVYKDSLGIYEGEFSSDCITGFGCYYFPNNETYKGTFLKGKMNGHGVYTWCDGSSYTGNYVNNKKEGQGIFKWANGRIFEGPFKNNKLNGFGKLTLPDKNKIINVEFKDDKLQKKKN